MAPDRVLLASTYLPPVAGGAEQVTWELAKRLISRFEVHILTAGRDRACVRDGVNIHYVIPFPFYTLSYSSLLRYKINTLLREISPDLIHSHAALPWGYIFSKAKSSRIITCHGSDVFPRKRPPASAFLMPALRHAHVVTTPSTWLAKYVERTYGISCVTIPNGVDLSVFRPLQAIEKKRNVVLFVGRFIEKKGILDVIEAARALPKYEFWFVGDPKQKDAIVIPRLPNVKMIGFIDDRLRLAFYYNKATICVFPSHQENFPLVGLEAMACGKAIVAAKIGFSTYVEHGKDGILVEPYDVDGLVNSIEYLMKEGDVRRVLEENARKKAARYDWNAIAQEYRVLYETLKQ
jgi:glycosyltransferase involved in cell wall biosynthesis